MLPWINRLTKNGRFHPMWIVLATIAIFVVAALLVVPALFEGAKAPPKTSALALKPVPAANLPEPDAGQQTANSIQKVHFTPPSESDIPSGEFGDMVKLGRNIFVHTQTYAKAVFANHVFIPEHRGP